MEEKSPAAVARETRVFLGKAQEALQQLAVLMRNTYFHDLANEVFREPLERLLATVESLVSEEGELELARVGQELFANGTRIRMELRSVHSYKLVCDELEKRELGGVRFEPGIALPALRTFLARFAALRERSEENAETLNGRLVAAGVRTVMVLSPHDEALAAGGDGSADRRERALRTYQEALDFIRKSVTELESPAQVNQRRAKRLIHKLVDLSYEEGDGFSMLGLASIKDHHNYTFNHMVNVCILAIAFGHRLGLGRQALAELGLCALYHDLGKLNIPLDVLNKPGRLTPEEWALMGNHTVFGARALLPLMVQDLTVTKRILAVLLHHVGYDGSGYPSLKVLTRQTLYARIIAVVDLFDAMTTKRVYQEEFLPDAALRRMLELAGSYCDPLLAKAFINCMGIFPVGSTVELAAGELGVVVEPSPDPDRLDRPKVRLITDRRQRQLKEPTLVDLAAPQEAGRTIRKCVDPEAYGITAAYYAV